MQVCVGACKAVFDIKLRFAAWSGCKLELQYVAGPKSLYTKSFTMKRSRTCEYMIRALKSCDLAFATKMVSKHPLSFWGSEVLWALWGPRSFRWFGTVCVGPDALIPWLRGHGVCVHHAGSLSCSQMQHVTETKWHAASCTLGLAGWVLYRSKVQTEHWTNSCVGDLPNDWWSQRLACSQC